MQTAEDVFRARAVDSLMIQWTWPVSYGVPMIGDWIDAIFPIELVPGWALPIRDKWEAFRGWVKTWVFSRPGTAANAAELLEVIVEGAELAAAALGFDLYGPEGLAEWPEGIFPLGGVGGAVGSGGSGGPGGPQ